MTSGKVVVITGAAGGIGQALCQCFLDQGDRVAMLDLRAEALELAATGFPPERVLKIPCDITNLEAFEQAIQQVRQTWGGLDTLVLNAGITHRSLFSETDLSVYRKVMEVNYFGSLNGLKAALPFLKQSKGMVVTLSSVAGFAPLIGRTGYAASKHALQGFFSSLRSELAPHGVGVLIACPAYARTAIEANALSGQGQPLGDKKKKTVGAYLDPSEVARQIVKATNQRKKTLYIGRVSKMSNLLNRLSPDTYEKTMVRLQKEEFNLP